MKKADFLGSACYQSFRETIAIGAQDIVERYRKRVPKNIWKSMLENVIFIKYGFYCKFMYWLLFMTRRLER